jgi:hypothetical protein
VALTPALTPLRRLAELLALTAFAVAQPILDVTGRSPDFFLYRRATAGQLRALLVLVVLGPPLWLWLVERAVGARSAVAERTLHLTFVAVLFGLLAVEAGKHAHVAAGVPLAAGATVTGCALAVLFARRPWVRQTLQYATPAPLVFALLFVVTTPAGALVRPAAGHGTIRAVATKRPPIVMVLLDEFPLTALLDAHGAVDARLFPNFARLAATSHWYPNATGVGGWTPYAAPAVLTGRYPRKAVAPSYVEHPENLFTLLAGTYDVHAYESVTQLCPPRVCSGVPAGRPTGLGALLADTMGVVRGIASPYPSAALNADAFVEEVGEATRAGAAQRGTLAPNFRFDATTANQPERFTSFLGSLTRSERPTLSYLHLLMPHTPWRYLPSGRSYPQPPDTFPVSRFIERFPNRVIAAEPALAAFGKQRLLLQLAYTDGLLGQLLDTLRDNGTFDESLVVVTADHGEGLDPGAHWRWMDEHSAPDLGWVPLFVKTPGEHAPKVDRRDERQVDVLPTIADVLDVHVPWTVDGVSVLAPARTGGTKRWYDVPGHAVTVATKAPPSRGLASVVAPAARSAGDLFGVGPLAPYVGRPVDSLDVGSPAAPVATLGVDVGHVRLGGGTVPAYLWGALDRPAGETTRWLLAAVNGHVAGTAFAMKSVRDGRWYFQGMVDDGYFEEGRNDVTLYAVEGTTLHPLPWAA